MKEKKNKKKLSRVGRLVLDIIMIVCLGVAVFSAYQVYKGLASYNQAGNAYDNLRKNAVTTKKDTDKDDTTSTLDFQKSRIQIVRVGLHFQTQMWIIQLCLALVQMKISMAIAII